MNKITVGYVRTKYPEKRCVINKTQANYKKMNIMFSRSWLPGVIAKVKFKLFGGVLRNGTERAYMTRL